MGNMKFFSCIIFFLVILTDLISGSVLNRDVPDLASDVAQCDGLLCPAGCCGWGDETYFCCPDMEPVCVPTPDDCWHLLTASNATPNAKMKMATRGFHNGQQGLEIGSISSLGTPNNFPK